MKYMALIYTNPASMTPPDSPEFGKMMEGYRIANETYHRDGVYVAGDALQAATTATTVRVRNGKTETMWDWFPTALDVRKLPKVASK